MPQLLSRSFWLRSPDKTLLGLHHGFVNYMLAFFPYLSAV